MEMVDEQEARRRELARSLDCFTSDELRSLAEITEGTEQAWRKRGTGPPYVLLGNSYLYPRKPLVEFLRTRVRVRRGVPPKELL